VKAAIACPVDMSIAANPVSPVTELVAGVGSGFTWSATVEKTPPMNITFAYGLPAPGAYWTLALIIPSAIQVELSGVLVMA
jgi:hypothetical protein